MAKLYWLGAALILIAVLYQYRREIKTLVLNLSSEEKETLTKSPTTNTVKENLKQREAADTKKQKTDSGQSQSEKEKTESESNHEDESKEEKDSSSKASKEYYNPPFDPKNPPDPIYSKTGTRLITLNELAAHGHSGSLKPIWLAIMGRVYDVNKGAEHYYGPNGGYKFFTGK